MASVQEERITRGECHEIHLNGTQKALIILHSYKLEIVL